MRLFTSLSSSATNNSFMTVINALSYVLRCSRSRSLKVALWAENILSTWDKVCEDSRFVSRLAAAPPSPGKAFSRLMPSCPLLPPSPRILSPDYLKITSSLVIWDSMSSSSSSSSWLSPSGPISTNSSTSTVSPGWPPSFLTVCEYQVVSYSLRNYTMGPF